MGNRRRQFAGLLGVKGGSDGLEPATSGVTGVPKRFSGLRLAAESARSCGFRQVRQPALFAWLHPVVSIAVPCASGEALDLAQGDNRAVSRRSAKSRPPARRTGGRRTLHEHTFDYSASTRASRWQAGTMREATSLRLPRHFRTEGFIQAYIP